MRAPEESDDAAVQKTLQAWHDSIVLENEKDLDAVKERLEWTIGWVKYRVAKAKP